MHIHVYGCKHVNMSAHSIVALDGLHLRRIHRHSKAEYVYDLMRQTTSI